MRTGGGTADSGAHQGPRGPVPRRVTFSWCFYDFANTMYSMNVTTMYFAQWIVIDNALEDIWYSTAYAISMAAAALSVPILGAMSDSRGRRMPYLFWFTILCVGFTALIGLIGRTPHPTLRVVLALGAFAVANYGFHASMVFYNALLPGVSTPRSIGRVSGYGVALGYTGAIAGLIIVAPFVQGVIPLVNISVPFIEPAGRIGAFVPTAVAFLICSLPLFLFVRDGDVPWFRGVKPASCRSSGSAATYGRHADPGQPISWRAGLSKVVTTFRCARRYPGLFRFLIANYLYEDAINTIIIFMAIYAEKVMGLPDTVKVPFFIVATTAAVAGSFLFGFVTDRLGPKKTLIAVLFGWMAALLGAVFTRNVLVFWGLGALVGVFMGGTWTSARPLLTRLSPPEMLGEVFGLYALSGKAAAILGPLIWGLVVLAAGGLGVVKYRIAAATLVLFVIAGLIVLWTVPDRRAGEGDALHP